jgi:hypothetical protein
MLFVDELREFHAHDEARHDERGRVAALSTHDVKFDLAVFVYVHIQVSTVDGALTVKPARFPSSHLYRLAIVWYSSF